MIETRLEELGIKLPDNAEMPVANYVAFKVIDNLVYISGQIAKWDGEIKYKGKLGKEFAVKEGQEAARICGLNLILQLREALGGDFSKLKQCVKLGVFVNATSDFTDHALVANGASDLMVNIFGEKGKHMRAAVGCSSLPLDTAVEVEGVFEIKS